MGSTFVKLNKQSASNSWLDTFSDQTADVFLQFVPGVVLDVATSLDSAAASGLRDINCIIAHPHLSGDEKINVKSMSKTKYYPLLRGMVDVPIKGDQVLLCTFGDVNYYIGPVNTINNPQFNIDHLGDKSEFFANYVETKKQAVSTNKALSKNFVRNNTRRLEKKYNDELDDLAGLKRTIRDIVGDTIFEGRYGNSMRLGSRDFKPLIIFSNGINEGITSETLVDGSSMIAMFSHGTIHQHFPKDSKFVDESSPEDGEFEVKQFKLASDSINDAKDEQQQRMIGELYNYSWGMDWEQNQQQLLINSQKITINSKKESMFLSSYQNIYIGAGGTINLISERETVIESQNVFLGKQAKTKFDEADTDNPAEPLVLGNQLRIFLEKILNMIKNLKVIGVQPGPYSGPPDTLTMKEIEGLLNELKNSEVTPFNSEYHFIEDNGSKTKSEEQQ